MGSRAVQLLREVGNEHGVGTGTSSSRLFYSQLAASSRLRSGAPETYVGRNLSVFQLLYELVVPPWPLLNWVTYRSANDQTGLLPRFLDRIRGSDSDLFAWDSDDDSRLSRRLSQAKDRIGLYPRDWNAYMVEIPLATWLQISNMTWTKNRPRFRFQIIPEWDDLDLRLTAMLLAYSSTPMAHEKILATLGIDFEVFGMAFDTTAPTFHGNYQEQILASFDSDKFWAGAKLDNWLSACDEAFCHDVWHIAHRTRYLHYLQVIPVVLNTLPRVRSSSCVHRSRALDSKPVQNLATCVYSLTRQQPGHDRYPPLF